MLKRVSFIAVTAVLLAGAALFFRPVRVAHAQAPSCSGSGSGEVCSVGGAITWYATDWGNNQVMVTLNQTATNPGNCSNAGQYETPASSETAEASALLAAVLSGKTVVLQIGTACTGTAGRASILGVQIAPAS